jgi:nicotinamide-nucleotide amidase
MNAEILAIGDEITSGQLLDTNSQWLSQRLQELGVRVLYHSTVGDELEPCTAVFRQAIQRADVVVATGGLGPTADDLTREALAAAVGRPLVLVPEALEHVRRLFAYRKRPMPPQNEVQAMFPEGSRVVPNPHGTAPGIDLAAQRPAGPPCRFFALPGVPGEMRDMWGYVADALRSLGAGQRVVRRRNLKCFGAGESQIESMLPDLIRRGRTPTVGITASRATITLRIVAEGNSPEECDALIEPTAAVIRQNLGTLVYGEGDDELQDSVVGLLRRHGRTLASAEIGTGGLVAQWLAGVPDADRHYRAGVVASSPAVLESLLGIDAAAFPEPALASAATARAIAIACRARFGADFGLGVGGLPTSPAQADETGSGEPALVHFALDSPAGLRTFQVPFGLHPDIRTIFCAKHAVNLVRLALLAASP